MDISKILVGLKSERDRISRAIAALEALDNVTVSAKVAAKQPEHRAASTRRKRLPNLRKLRRTTRRKTAAKSSLKAVPVHHPLSTAARKKIAAAQRARWAARKKSVAQKTSAKRATAVKSAVEKAVKPERKEATVAVSTAL